MAAGTLAVGLANFAPAILGRSDVYEVAIGCGYALTMLALLGIWCALQEGKHSWRWLAAASLAYGLAVGARPSLLFGGIILLAPVVQAWRARRRVWPLWAAAVGPMVVAGVGLMLYNLLRFDNPLEFGQRYQLPLAVHEQFSLRYLWFNFRVAFLQPARWSGRFPFVNSMTAPAPPAGYCQLDDPFGVLISIPVVWLALAAPLAWRGRTAEARSNLRWFLGAVALLFGMWALPMLLHDSMCLRYEMEFAFPMVLLAVVGILAVERALAGRPLWRRAARCGWGVLLACSLAFNLFASYKSNIDDRQNFGFALLETGRADEAITQYQKALQMRPDNEAAHNNFGNALLQKGRVNEAITQYQEALQINPDVALPHLNLGNALQQKGRLDEAITQYQRAVEIQPDDLAARCGFGYVLLQKGRADEAILQYQQAVQLNPAYAEAHNNLGNALLQKGRLDEAITQYELALQFKPAYAEAGNNLGNALLQKGRLDEAIPLFQQALKMKPDYAEAWNNLGSALLQKGRVDEAIARFQEALKIKPDDTVASHNLGNALLQQGRVDEGILQYQHALQINPNPMEVRINLGNALLLRGRVAEAIAQYQGALELKPSDPAIQNNLAWLLATCPQASLRDGGKAVELARQANVLTGGENPVILHTLAAACAEAGRFSEAVEAAQHALRLAQAQSNTGLAAALESELKLYQAGSPLHSPEQPH